MPGEQWMAVKSPRKAAAWMTCESLPHRELSRIASARRDATRRKLNACNTLGCGMRLAPAVSVSCLTQIDVPADTPVLLGERVMKRRV